MSLKEFISQVKTEGIAKTNLFEVDFTLPQGNGTADIGLSSDYNLKLRNVLLFCDSTQLPGLTISTNQIRTFGELREMPYDKLFDSLNLSFYVDNNLTVKSLFDSWFALIQDPVTRTFTYYENYITPVTIRVLDKKNQTRYEIKLHEAYPKAMSPIQLDYSNHDIMRLNVQFVFKYWEVSQYASSGDTQSVASPFTAMKDAFSSNLPIPRDYFSNFAGFQDKVNSIKDNIVGGITSDLKSKVTTVASNLPKVGDNLNFDSLGPVINT